MTQHLFSYGTLQQKDVQIATFGRELTGRPDALPGHTRTLVADPRDETPNANVEPSPNPADAVTGTVFEVTEPELAAADKYEEPANYHRISVTLQSGQQSWIYVHKGPR